jgi:hypothetical protein
MVAFQIAGDLEELSGLRGDRTTATPIVGSEFLTIRAAC